jgi:hypothetical protein
LVAGVSFDTLFTVTGLGFIVVFFVWWVAEIVLSVHVRNNGKRTSGTLSDVKYSRDSEGEAWQVTYEYEVDGKVYTGHQLYNSRIHDETAWEAGRQVVVAYEPRRPSMSVVDAVCASREIPGSERIAHGIGSRR